MTITLDGPLLLVGAGKMGGALLTGWLDRGLDPARVFIQDPNLPEQVAALVDTHNIASGMPPELPAPPSVLVLAVKPQAVADTLPDLKHLVEGDTVVLSIAAGQTLATLARHLGEGCSIVRSMPNTPAAIGRGITVACSNTHVTADQAQRCITLLSAVGEVAWIEDEGLLDAVTAVSGSGPAYVFLLTECLAAAGVEAGLSEDLAAQLARDTVSGAGELMHQSDHSAEELRHQVTSPGGTTEAALKILAGKGGLEPLMARAVKAAAKRSRELSS